MEKEKPRNRNIQSLQAIRTFRLVLCAGMIGAVWYCFIYYPMTAMVAVDQSPTADKWALGVIGFIASQVLIFSMYREIKYGGWKKGRWVN